MPERGEALDDGALTWRGPPLRTNHRDVNGEEMEEGVTIFPSEVGEMGQDFATVLRERVGSQERVERARRISELLSVDLTWVDRWLDALGALASEESGEVSEWLRRLREGGLGRSDATTAGRLDHGGVLIAICHPRFASGGPLSVQRMVEAVSSQYGRSVGFLFSPISEPMRTPYAPYSPSARGWLDPRAFTVQTTNPSTPPSQAFLEASGIEGLLNACFEASEESIAPRRPEDVMVRGVDDDLLARACSALSRQSMIFERWRELASRAAIVHDLPVSFVRHGFDAWLYQDLVLPGCEMGAPPDPLALDGQSWGLAVVDPSIERTSGLYSYSRTLRLLASLGFGVRVDHAIGLRRRFAVPDGGDAKGGAFVELTGESLVPSLARVAAELRIEILAEDLGVLPYGLRDELRANKCLGTVVPYFGDERVSRKRDSLQGEVVSLGTFDLPTIGGLLGGGDADELRRLGRHGEADSQPEMLSQLRDFAAIDGVERVSSGDDVSTLILALVRASRYRGARAVSILAEDLLDEPIRANVPGTTASMRVNWTLPVPGDLDSLLAALSPLSDIS